VAGENPNDLIAFLTVARERNFTRVAAKLGVSQPALSQTIRGPWGAAGLRLLATIGPALDEIDTGLTVLSALRDKPAGSIRTTADEHAVRTVLWPALEWLMLNYPYIKVEITIDYGLTDIVAERYDPGVGLRAGRKDMVAEKMLVPGKRRRAGEMDLTGAACVKLLYFRISLLGQRGFAVAANRGLTQVVAIAVEFEHVFVRTRACDADDSKAVVDFLDILGSHLDVHCSEVFLEVVQLGRTRDRHDRRILCEQPSQCDLYRGCATLALTDASQQIDDRAVRA
jgi:hypothetical protein